MEKELDELLEAALAPKITRVECALEEDEQTKEYKASYHVFWENKGSSVSYMLHLYENGTEVWTEKAEAVIQYEFTRNITKDANYKFFMTPTDNPDLKSEIVTLPSKNLVTFHMIRAEENSLILDYTLEGAVDSIYVQLSNEAKKVCRNVELKPYDRVISLSVAGLSGIDTLVCKMSLLSKSGTVAIYQKLPDKLAVSVDMGLLKIKGAQFQEIQQGKLSGTLTLEEDSPWIEASGCLLYVLGGADEWKVGELAVAGKGRFLFQLTEDIFTSGIITGLAVRLTSGIAVSRLSHTIPLVTSQPKVLRGEFCNHDTYAVSLEEKGKEERWKKAVLTREEETVTEYFQGSTYQFPYSGVTGISIQYVNGISEGSTVTVPMEDSIYMYEEDSSFLWSGSSPVCEKKTIEVQVSLQKEPEQAVAGTYFRLEKKDSGMVLSIEETVWEQDETTASALRADYQDFLKKLDGIVEAKDIYMLRSVIADRLPQRMEDISFYAFGFHENGIDVLPGMELAVEYSSYQRVDVTDDMKYFNGFAGAKKEYYPVLWRDGYLSMDSFVYLLSEGKYVSNAEQPDANNEAKAYGGAGGMDLAVPAARKAFARILYPDVFPDREGQGEAVSVQNEVLAFADSYTSLLLAAGEFSKKAYSSQGYFTHFRGRAHITPVIEVCLNEMAYQVPVMTRLGDLAERFQWDLELVCLLRNGIRLDGRLIQNVKAMEGFLLRAGDRIWLRG